MPRAELGPTARDDSGERRYRAGERQGIGKANSPRGASAGRPASRPRWSGPAGTAISAALNRLGRQPARRAAGTTAGVRPSRRGNCLLHATAKRRRGQQPRRVMPAIRTRLRQIVLRHRPNVTEGPAIGTFIVIGRHPSPPSSVAGSLPLSGRPGQPRATGHSIGALHWGTPAAPQRGKGLPANRTHAMLHGTTAARMLG